MCFDSVNFSLFACLFTFKLYICVRMYTKTRVYLTCSLWCAGCSTCHCPLLAATTSPTPRSLRLWSSTARTATPRPLAWPLSARVLVSTLGGKVGVCVWGGGGFLSHSTVLSGYCSLIVRWEGAILESSLAFHSHSTVLIAYCSLVVRKLSQPLCPTAL